MCKLFLFLTISTTGVYSSGESEKPCVVSLAEDSIHEDDEEFRLVLGTPKSTSQYGAAVGEQKEALVTVTDKKDSKTLNISNVLNHPTDKTSIKWHK